MIRAICSMRIRISSQPGDAARELDGWRIIMSSKQPAQGTFDRYMHRVIELTASDPRVTATLLRVRNLLKPLSTLFQPRIILAVLRQELAAFRQQPTMTT